MHKAHHTACTALLRASRTNRAVERSAAFGRGVWAATSCNAGGKDIEDCQIGLASLRCLRALLCPLRRWDAAHFLLLMQPSDGLASSGEACGSAADSSPPGLLEASISEPTLMLMGALIA